MDSVCCCMLINNHSCHLQHTHRNFLPSIPFNSALKLLLRVCVTETKLKNLQVDGDRTKPWTCSLLQNKHLVLLKCSVATAASR